MPGSDDPADAVPGSPDVREGNGGSDLPEGNGGTDPLEEDLLEDELLEADLLEDDRSVLDALPGEDAFEERRSRLRGIARLFGGLLVGGSIAALVVALAVALLAGLGPRLIVVVPGTTEEPVPRAETSTPAPEPVETITKKPGDAE